MLWSGTFCNSMSEGVGAPEPLGADHESPTVLFREFDDTAAVLSPASGFMTVGHTRAADKSWVYGIGGEVIEDECSRVACAWVL